MYKNVQGVRKIRVELAGEDHWKRDPVPPAKVFFNDTKAYTIDASSHFALQHCIRLISTRECFKDDLYLTPKDWDELESWGYEIPWKNWLNTKSEEWFFGKGGHRQIGGEKKKTDSFAGMKQGFLMSVKKKKA